jgi:type I restriction enzyme S subunit
VKHSGLYITEYAQTYSDAGLEQSRLWPAGTLCITIAANIADTGILSFDACFPDSVIGFIPDNRKADARFVKYLFDSTIQRRVQQFTQGAAQDNLSQEKLLSIKFSAPGVEDQRRIADILSAYDDLIENNRRRMALLEKAARLLYEEWFVRLRFPGHEHTQTINGVPEGWNPCALDDLCHIGRGASPRPIMKFMGGEIPWFKIGDATASENCFIFQTREHVTEVGAKNSVLLDPGALILSNSATCGVPYFTGVRGCVHDGWLHFSQLKRISEQFLYCYLYFKREELVSSVGDGSTQKNLNTTAVGRLRLCLPCVDTLLTLFQQMTEPVFSMARNLAQQNMALKAARDLLLPRLMSGEIAV